MNPEAPASGTGTGRSDVTRRINLLVAGAVGIVAIAATVALWLQARESNTYAVVLEAKDAWLEVEGKQVPLGTSLPWGFSLKTGSNGYVTIVTKSEKARIHIEGNSHFWKPAPGYVVHEARLYSGSAVIEASPDSSFYLGRNFELDIPAGSKVRVVNDTMEKTRVTVLAGYLELEGCDETKPGDTWVRDRSAAGDHDYHKVQEKKE